MNELDSYFSLPRPTLSAPSKLDLIGEVRIISDLIKMALFMFISPKKNVASRNRHIIVFPGLGTDDRITGPLRWYLSRIGHRVEGWRLGKNLAGFDIRHKMEDLPKEWRTEHHEKYRYEGGVPMLCEKAKAWVIARHAQIGHPITLVGWSLGGYVAREVARDCPNLIEQVITMGAPVQGGPKYTAAAGVFAKRGMNLDWVEREIARRDRRPIQVPITSIISTTDSMIGYEAAKDHVSPNLKQIELSASHFGMCFNPRIWRLVRAALE